MLSLSQSTTTTTDYSTLKASMNSFHWPDLLTSISSWKVTTRFWSQTSKIDEFFGSTCSRLAHNHLITTPSMSTAHVIPGWTSTICARQALQQFVHDFTALHECLSGTDLQFTFQQKALGLKPHSHVPFWTLQNPAPKKYQNFVM